jgi:hypothetical protein
MERIVAEIGKDFRYPVQVAPNFWIGPKSFDQLDGAEFFNHSCSPSCGIKGQILIVAMRDVEAGEELTFDYGMTEIQDMEMECHCGSPECRRIINGDSWKDPNFQKKYKGYLSWNVEQKIKSSKNRAV